MRSNHRFERKGQSGKCMYCGLKYEVVRQEPGVRRASGRMVDVYKWTAKSRKVTGFSHSPSRPPDVCVPKDRG